MRYGAEQGWKPIIITNGQNLTSELLKELLQADVKGFTMYVDSHQNRPNMVGLRSEADLNEFRLEKARMIKEAGRGKIFCAFNANYISRYTKGRAHVDQVGPRSHHKKDMA